MPTYNFRNKETGEITEVVLSLAEREEVLQDPNMEQVHLGAPGVAYRGIGKKPDNGFRDVLKGIKKANIRSNINTF